jgi:aminoglycoside phosphotransferase (APT) family kinase protein
MKNHQFGVSPMPSNSARLMRAISKELSQHITPELKTADAIERATLSDAVLQNLANDIDVLAEVAKELIPAFRATLGSAIQSLPKANFEQQIAAWDKTLLSIEPETGLAAQQEVTALRSLATEIVREATDSLNALTDTADAANIAAVISQLGTMDYQWLTAYDSAKNQHDKNQQGSNEAQQEQLQEKELLTPETLTTYLRQRYSDSPDIEVTEILPIPGGRSKKTFFISVSGTSELPAQFVMRQDFDLRYEGTKVRDEYTPLVGLAKMQLPVPKPMLLEAEENALGSPFIFVDKLSGKPPGSYFGLNTVCPGAFADLAKTLAKLHQAAPDDLGLTAAAEPEQALLKLIDGYEEKWRNNATSPSPLVDYALSWARQQCLLDSGTVAVVHGDAGPYNFLVENDRLTAMLDWEFIRVGDAAEDLGVARFYAEDVMQWDDFLAIYHAEGGPEVPDRRIQLSMLLQFIKGATLVATSARNYEEGWTKEFVKGATSFAGLRTIEMRIAALLRRFEAI